MTDVTDKNIYTNPSHPLQERVLDLISRMTLEEKVTQLLHSSKAVPRLKIPEYDWWSECLHGVGRAGLATVFPQAIGLAATFDPDLLFRVATAISDEARAKYNAAQRIDNRRRYRGLTFWSPNINIFRDPRWGRGQETYGEDPFLTSCLGVAFIRGLQGDDPRYLKVAACAKHFAVHSGPEKDRHHFNAVVSPRDLNATYLPAFKALVDAGVEAVMGAYNRTNDEPCCGSRFLLVDILREKWQFKGHIVSDCWAIRDFHVNHKITATPEESLALALQNGCDLNCGCIYDSHHLRQALAKGLITEELLDRALVNLFRTRFKLGMFDPPENVPFSSLGEEVIDCDRHRELAYEAAVKSIVLLKNRNQVLPLKRDLKTIYVFGANAVDIELLMGNYNGYSSKMISILEGIVGKAGKGTSVIYKRAEFRQHAAEVDQGFMNEVKTADAFIAVMGITPRHEGEEGPDADETGGKGDRRDITLPGNQPAFLKSICTMGIPVVVVLTAGSQLAIAEIHDLVDAILYTWYPGEEGGNAVGDIIFGNVSPSGKLPITFPRSLDQLPAFDDYSMQGRTYRYMKAEPLYPFGFGLGYSSFTYSNLELSRKKIRAGDSLTASVTVTNAGDTDSDEVVQLYLTHQVNSVDLPLYELKGFQRVCLKTGVSKKLSFTLGQEALSIINDRGETVLAPGEVTINVGGSLPDRRSAALDAAPCVSGSFYIE